QVHAAAPATNALTAQTQTADLDVVGIGREVAVPGVGFIILITEDKYLPRRAGTIVAKAATRQATLMRSWLGGHSAGVATEIGVTMGASVSFTVTVKLVLVLAWLVQVTVVVPRAKKEPDAGKQVIVPQLPVKLGSG